MNLDVTVRDGSSDEKSISSSSSSSSSSSGGVYDNNNSKKGSLYDKYNSTNRKKVNSLFLKKDQQQQRLKEQKLAEQQQQGPLLPGFYPAAAILGANPERIRSYGGRQLSQSDFERKILGVSTATEISVKSVICVKGQCFNADEGKLKSK